MRRVMTSIADSRTLQTSGESAVQAAPDATNLLRRVCMADWENNLTHLPCLSRPLMAGRKERLPVEHWNWACQEIGKLSLVLTVPSIQLPRIPPRGDTSRVRWAVDLAVRNCYLA